MEKNILVIPLLTTSMSKNNADTNWLRFQESAANY